MGMTVLEHTNAWHKIRPGGQGFIQMGVVQEIGQKHYEDSMD